MSRWPADDRRARDLVPRPTLFLDRDGVVVVEKDYLSRADDVELEAGVGPALRRAREAGFQLVGLSNQSGLGRGKFTPADLAAVMTRLDELLAAAGCPFDAFLYCPHAPEAGCRCRKPGPGLLEEAAAMVRWEPARSWLIGDKISDVDLAVSAGLGPVLVRTGHGAVEAPRLGDRPEVLVCADLATAVAAILEAQP
ncbi:MAG: HAD family hydrolase [Candidatus Krumholzibacteriia bacterium]